MFWLWLRLLHFNVANQIHGVEEDRRNKSFRPLPAGRIDIHSATILRWVLIPVYFLASILYSEQTLCSSVAFAALTFIYNDMHADAGFWLLHNMLNGLGLAALGWGTTLVAGK